MERKIKYTQLCGGNAGDNMDFRLGDINLKSNCDVIHVCTQPLAKILITSPD